MNPLISVRKDHRGTVNLVCTAVKVHTNKVICVYVALESIGLRVQKEGSRRWMSILSLSRGLNESYGNDRFKKGLQEKKKTRRRPQAST